MVKLIEEIVLLAYDDQTGTNTSGSRLDLGMAGAALIDLALLGRISVTDGMVTVVDHRPTEHAVLDGALSRIVASKPRKPAQWVNRLYVGITKRARDHMVEREILYRDKTSGLIGRTRYLPTDPSVEREIRDRLESAARRERADDPRTSALAGVIHALWIEKCALPDMPYQQARAALRAVSTGGENDSVDAGVRATVRAVNALLWAIAGTVTAGVAVTAMGN